MTGALDNQGDYDIHDAHHEVEGVAHAFEADGDMHGAQQAEHTEVEEGEDMAIVDDGMVEDASMHNA